MSWRDVLSIAMLELGEGENPPGSNRTKYGGAFGWNGVPWCVIFLWWCFRQAGERMAFYDGLKTASCSSLLSWAKTEKLVVQLSELQPGDIVLYNFNLGRSPEHAGLAIAREGKYIISVEGNTTAGAVEKKRRHENNVVAVIRPKYKEVETDMRYQSVEACPEWSRPTVQKLVDKGYLKGFEWGLNLSEDMLRLLVILDRAGAFGGEDRA